MLWRKPSIVPTCIPTTRTVALYQGIAAPGGQNGGRQGGVPRTRRCALRLECRSPCAGRRAARHPAADATAVIPWHSGLTKEGPVLMWLTPPITGGCVSPPQRLCDTHCSSSGRCAPVRLELPPHCLGIEVCRVQGLISLRARLRRVALSVYQWIRVCVSNFTRDGLQTAVGSDSCSAARILAVLHRIPDLEHVPKHGSQLGRDPGCRICPA